MSKGRSGGASIVVARRNSNRTAHSIPRAASPRAVRIESALDVGGQDDATTQEGLTARRSCCERGGGLGGGAARLVACPVRHTRASSDVRLTRRWCSDTNFALGVDAEKQRFDARSDAASHRCPRRRAPASHRVTASRRRNFSILARNLLRRGPTLGRAGNRKLPARRRPPRYSGWVRIQVRRRRSLA